MRRGKEPGPESGLTQETLDVAGGRSLAVGPGNVDGGKTVLRVLKGAQKQTCPFEPELSPTSLKTK